MVLSSTSVGLMTFLHRSKSNNKFSRYSVPNAPSRLVSVLPLARALRIEARSLSFSPTGIAQKGSLSRTLATPSRHQQGARV